MPEYYNDNYIQLYSYEILMNAIVYDLKRFCRTRKILHEYTYIYPQYICNISFFNEANLRGDINSVLCNFPYLIYSVLSEQDYHPYDFPPQTLLTGAWK